MRAVRAFFASLSDGFSGFAYYRFGVGAIPVSADADPFEPEPCSHGLHATVCATCGHCQCFVHPHRYQPVEPSQFYPGRVGAALIAPSRAPLTYPATREDAA